MPGDVSLREAVLARRDAQAQLDAAVQGVMAAVRREVHGKGVPPSLVAQQAGLSRQQVYNLLAGRTR